MNTKKLTFSALLIAIGVFTGTMIYIPVGVAKCFPVQHSINVLAGVLLGPRYSVAIAFCISLLRNILGTGSLLAFPGSMIGAYLAGMLYEKRGNIMNALTGEVVGTGIIGALISYPIAKFILGKKIAALFYVAPFLISSLGGAIIAFSILKIFSHNLFLKKFNKV
ncbi:energy coupling factor transporter S component ThiW [Clostridium sp. MSJ-11]|uniref:Energy coupling factor transporter S component ThiW n=1 Tax=Clostridium mobile TaxID=2841512 RepID=A0ABS6ED35_9CLOT|nr:energy coupling factor transporter S component ThiW [Clostridium mobile]MBU5483106.1 energy coupling factor transporter S component ThiW [Clostridium mobile]